MIALNPKALSLINTSFASPDAQVLISASANSPLLASMLNAFANKMGPNNTGPSIVLGNAGTMTSSDGLTITINPANVAPSQGGTTALFITTVAHELGHATLPGGVTPAGFYDPSQAQANGETNEGIAVSAEYVVADQLNLVSGMRSSAAGQAGEFRGRLTLFL